MLATGKNILKCQKKIEKNSRVRIDILRAHIKFCEKLIFSTDLCEKEKQNVPCTTFFYSKICLFYR
jgi:hypothetical protein